MKFRQSLAAVSLALAWSAPAPLPAATLTWDTDPATAGAQDGAGTWDTVATNWLNISTNVAWNNANPDSAIFGNGGAGGVVTLAEPITISNLTFNAVSGANTYRISGSTLTLSAAPTNVILMTASAAIDSTIAGNGFRKAGSGTLTLLGANTFTGAVSLSAGILVLSNGNALGLAPTITVPNTTKLRLAGGVTVTGTAAVISGTHSDNIGALTSDGGSNTWAGPITIGASGTRIGVATTATLVISGVMDSGTNILGPVFRSADSAVNPIILTAPNTWLGLSAVFLGRVKISGGDDRLPTNSVLEIGNSSDVNFAHFDLGGVNQAVAGLSAAGANMTKVLTNTEPVLSTLTINAGANSTYFGLIAGQVAIVKNGTGTQIFRTTANTYTGGTIINAGTLALGNDGQNNQSSRGLGNGPVTVNAGGTLRLGGSTAGNSFSLSNHVVLAGGTIWAQEGIQRFTNATFTVGPSGGTLVTVNGNKDIWIDDALLGSGPLTMDNAATTTGGTAAVRFNGPGSTYDGTITVNGASPGFLGGRLSIQRDSALANATLVMNGTNGVGFGSAAPVLGALSGAGDIPISNGIVFSVGNNGSNTTYAGILSGAGSLGKVGAGVLTLTAHSTLTNTTTISAGALALAATASLSNSPVSLAGGTFDVTALAPFVIPAGAPVSGSGTVSGAVVVAEGSRLAPGTDGTPGTIAIAGGLSLNSALTNSFDLADSSFVGGGVNDLLVVDGGFEPSNATVRINQLVVLSNGAYRLVNYSGAKLTGFNTNVIGNVSHKSWTLDQATAGQVNLVISGSYGNLRWNPLVSTNWDLTDPNWFDMTTLQTNTFLTYDAVLFDDSGAFAPGVNLATNVQPGSVVVNATGDYAIGGNGRISGTAGLTKAGPGTLTLGGTGNDFTGPVLITNGVLKLATSTALGSRNTGTTVNGGTLDINGVTNIAGDIITILGNGYANAGTIINSGAFNDRSIRAVVLGADAAIGSHGNTWHIRGTNVVDLAGFTLTKLGGGIVFIVDMATTNTGNINVASGTLSFARGQVGGEGVIGVAPNAALSVENFSSGYFCKDVALTSSVLRILNNSITATSRLSVAGSATNEVGANLNFIPVFPITGPGSLVKSGGGRLVFATTNSFAGPLVIANSGGGVNLNSAAGPAFTGSVILGNLPDGGGAAFLTASNSAQFGAGSTIAFAGSPGDNSWLKLFGTTQTVEAITSDDNGGGVIDNVQDGSINSDGVLIIAGSGPSIFSGSAMRDSFPPSASTGRLRIVQDGIGTLTLAGAGTNMLFSGGVVANRGTLNLKAGGCAGVAPVVLAGGTLALDGAGLQEGVLSGGSTNINQPNPLNAGVKLSTRRANLTTDFPTTTTWAYTGYLVVTNPAGAVYTFAENFDDTVNLKIDGGTVLNDSVHNVPTLATVGLAPGLHRFDLRLFNNTGGAGPFNSSWWTNTAFGVGFDPLGRGEANLANYQPIADAGDGVLFCTDVTITNDLSLLSNAQIRVSNAIGPTNSLTGAIADGGANLSVTKTGAGILRLAGVNTYGGATLVDGGTLLVDGYHAGAGAITVRSNTALWGTGVVAAAAVTVEAGGVIGPRSGASGGTFTVTNLALAGGTTFHALLNGGAATIRVTGDLASSPGITVRLQPVATPPAVGTSVLLDYDGAFAGSIGDFAVASFPNGSQGYLTNNLANTSIDLVITNAGAGIRWDGTVNGSWDIAGTANWKSVLSGSAAPFNQGDSVIFDDTASGNFAIHLPQSVDVASLAVSNETQNYTFTGASIGGGFGLTKLGAARLTLDNPNSFTGATLVGAGTLAIRYDNSLGAAPAAGTPGHLTLNTGTTLEVLTNATIASTRQLAVGPSSGSGAATLSVATGSTVTASGVIADVPGGTGTLVKAGSGTLIPSAFNTYSGGTVVDGGTLQINLNGSATPANNALPAGAPVTVQNGATLRLVGGTALGQGPGNPSVVTVSHARVTTVAGNTHQDTPKLVLRGGYLSSEGAGDQFGNYIHDSTNFVVLADAAPSVIDAVTFDPRGSYNDPKPYLVHFNVEDGAAEMDLLVTALVQDFPGGPPGRLVKAGEGTMVMTADAATNAYSGLTLVSEGTLMIGTNGMTGAPGRGPLTVDARLVLNLVGAFSNALAGTGVVVNTGSGTLALTSGGAWSGGLQISNGTLLAQGTISPGSVTVASGATLGGGGTITANVSSDGGVAPGGSAGVLSIDGTYAQNSGAALRIELGGTGGPGVDSDMLAITGSATLDGTLQVTLINGYTPALGDFFSLLTANGLSGGFATTNLPALAPGLAWDVQYVAGLVITLEVVSGTGPTGYDLYAQQISNPAERGPQADPDGDGYANLLEYVTGGNPTNVDSTARLNAGRTNGVFALRFTRAVNATDATIYVEGATSAANNAPWAGIAINSNGLWTGATVNETGGPNPVNVTVQDTAASATNRFLRLRVTRP